MGPSQRKIERILLLFPPVINARIKPNECEIPLGMASLAAFVRDKVEVVCLDARVEGYHHQEDLGNGMISFGLGEDEIIRRIEKIQPDLVGFSCIFSVQFPIIRRLSEQVKKLDPSIITVAGGSHPAALAQRCLEATTLDYIVLGEGELAFSRLIDCLQRAEEADKIPGLAFREGDKIGLAPSPEYIFDLDQLPLPARELFPVEDYFKINVPMQSLSHSARNMAVSTSRGCPYRCGYCLSTIHWGHRFRVRSAENVLAELEELKSRYRIREVKFEDDNLTFDKQRAQKLFSGMISRRLDLAWNTPNGTSVWTLDEAMLELMKEAGCYEITVAVESGDPWVLKNLIKKPVNLEKTKAKVKVIKKLGIETAGFFIIGFPGETRAQIMNTINYARSLELDRTYMLLYSPLPGTPLTRLAMDMGKLPQDYDFENINSYFHGSDLSQIPAEEIKKIQRRALWGINLAFLFYHPVRFFKKYSRTLYFHPDWAWKFLYALFH